MKKNLGRATTLTWSDNAQYQTYFHILQYIYISCSGLDQFLFALSCKNTHRNTRAQTHTHTHTDAHKDSDEYSIAFCKNATIKTQIRIPVPLPAGMLGLNYIKPTSLFYIRPTLTCNLHRYIRTPFGGK